ncbi:four-carbon acid sugar kinase family protein [Flavicella sediminum]|uniref:four-carbon acid sugar kinase family protein n=1 Tax=Flavicella sediminum TaxID=2585141 RepID=UPI00111E04EF|nr:four-carbon acid sugar kinase family protein [Flavicella sediminum]
MTEQIDIKLAVYNSDKQKSYKEEIAECLSKSKPVIVVLDDDPTGTQTVHGVSVLTDWEQETLDGEFESGTRVFFILTNSRSFQENKAYEVAKTIADRVGKSASKYNKSTIILSRGDSTLRGHYQAETSALENGLGLDNCKQFLIPAFFEGGRVTVNDVHYMEQDGVFFPVGESPFAKDATFGYTASNLKEWISEKTGGLVKAEAVQSFSLDVLRKQGPVQVCKTLLVNKADKFYVVNATCYEDLQSFALGFLQSALPAVIRCSASFVNAIANIEKKELLEKSELISTGIGGLTIVGSYVPKTTAQLTKLKENKSYAFYEVEVTKLLQKEEQQIEINKAIHFIDANLGAGKEVVIYTSRLVKTGIDGVESLKIVNQVSSSLIRIVKGLQTCPKYILAKGGITSSDIAVKALGVKKAFVEGQIIPGVPVWKLGEETKFPKVPYIIFPGNVGDNDALAHILTKLNNE